MKKIEEIEQLLPKAWEYVNQARANKNQLIHLEHEQKEQREKLKHIQHEMTTTEDALSVINSLMEKVANRHIEELENIVTQVLHTVFFDREYTFFIRVSDRGANKQAEMFLREVRDGEIIETSLRDGVGGGIQAVIGFVIQVFYIQQLQAKKVLFLDESFSQLSSLYVEALLTFLSVLCDQEGFRILFITHDERFMANATQILAVDSGRFSVVR